MKKTRTRQHFVRLDIAVLQALKDLTSATLLCFIRDLSRNKVCSASNPYLAQKLCKNEKTIKRTLARLKRENYITTQVIWESTKGGVRVKTRYILLTEKAKLMFNTLNEAEITTTSAEDIEHRLTKEHTEDIVRIEKELAEEKENKEKALAKDKDIVRLDKELEELAEEQEIELTQEQKELHEQKTKALQENNIELWHELDKLWQELNNEPIEKNNKQPLQS